MRGLLFSSAADPLRFVPWGQMMGARTDSPSSLRPATPVMPVRTPPRGGRTLRYGDSAPAHQDGAIVTVRGFDHDRAREILTGGPL